MTVTFAAASKHLLRTTLLDAVRTLMVDRDWSKVTMSDVARQAGVSRQTVYNEFGSRNGVAQAYAMRLVDEFTAEIGHAVEGALPGDVDGALTDGFARFFLSAARDPMITSLLSGEANPDLHRLITTDAAPLISAAKVQLQQILTDSWMSLTPESAGPIAGAVARMALSYVAMPPEVDASVVAGNLTAVFGPAIREVRAR